MDRSRPYTDVVQRLRTLLLSARAAGIRDEIGCFDVFAGILGTAQYLPMCEDAVRSSKCDRYSISKRAQIHWV